MTSYRTGYTVDELGGILPQPRYTGDYVLNFATANSLANALTADGRCGFVERDDRAILAPDGTWIQEEAQS